MWLILFAHRLHMATAKGDVSVLSANVTTIKVGR